MARPKGSPNKIPRDEAQAYVQRVEHMLHAGGMKGGLEALACRYLTGDDIKTGFGVWRTLLQYKYGMPSQPLEGNISVNLTGIIEKARKRAE